METHVLAYVELLANIYLLNIVILVALKFLVVLCLSCNAPLVSSCSTKKGKTCKKQFHVFVCWLCVFLYFVCWPFSHLLFNICEGKRKQEHLCVDSVIAGCVCNVMKKKLQHTRIQIWARDHVHVHCLHQILWLVVVNVTTRTKTMMRIHMWT